MASTGRGAWPPSLLSSQTPNHILKEKLVIRSVVAAAWRVPRQRDSAPSERPCFPV